MKQARRAGIAVLGAGLLLVLGGVATATGAEDAPVPYGPTRKLGRGLANVVTAPLELIRTSELVARREGFIPAMSVGLLQGAWRTLLRGLTGIYDVVTFPLPMPRQYGPLFEPEFVWQHGDWTE